MHAYKIHAYEMAHGRCTLARYTPMRWPMERHAYERYTPMRCTLVRGTPMWPMGEARI
jgi:hypothetical protein